MQVNELNSTEERIRFAHQYKVRLPDAVKDVDDVELEEVRLCVCVCAHFRIPFRIPEHTVVLPHPMNGGVGVVCMRITSSTQ